MSCSLDVTSSPENSNTNNATTSSSNTDESIDGSWLKLKKIFGQNEPLLTKEAKLQPGFVPMKSDFNIPTDGLPATTIKSRKAGRSIRWGCVNINKMGH